MTRPDFVFIMTDTQGANMVGAYGRPELQTANIDRLAAEGVLFERGYTNSPLCTPARSVIFTGTYPHLNGAWSNTLAVNPKFAHMGQRFRDAGYRTVYTGKWHLDGHDYYGSGLCPDGWDDRYWFDARRYLETLTPAQRTLWRSGLNTVEALREHDIRPEFTFAHGVSNRAIEFLREQRNRRDGSADDRPFVLVVSYDEPHGPFTCPSEYAERFVGYRYPLGPGAHDDLRDKPVHQQEWAAARPQTPYVAAGQGDYLENPRYFGCNSFVDSEIGRVLEAVERYAPEDTYVIYTSDHGEMWGSHGLWSKGACVYEENVRVPFIIRPPRDVSGAAGVSAGRRSVTPVSHVDLLPTMLDLAGLPVPPLFLGQSLAPWLTGAPDDPQRRVFVEWGRYELPQDHWGGFTPMRSLVKWPYKLSLNLFDTDELYDCGDDPHELKNRIEDPAYAQVRNALHDELLDWMYRDMDPFRGPPWERRPWRQDRKLTWRGGWTGPRRGWDDRYEPPRLNQRTGLPLEQ
ncbi:MAG: sulfatase-like hydrolase/transferase [Chloroflexi bacterium]|nr:sulfatase-like hydrolase/transferase [Chloroflexota bacterium]